MSIETIHKTIQKAYFIRKSHAFDYVCMLARWPLRGALLGQNRCRLQKVMGGAVWLANSENVFTLLLCKRSWPGQRGSHKSQAIPAAVNSSYNCLYNSCFSLLLPTPWQNTYKSAPDTHIRRNICKVIVRIKCFVLLRLALRCFIISYSYKAW